MISDWYNRGTKCRQDTFSAFGWQARNNLYSDHPAQRIRVNWGFVWDTCKITSLQRIKHCCVLCLERLPATCRKITTFLIHALFGPGGKSSRNDSGLLSESNTGMASLP